VLVHSLDKRTHLITHFYQLSPGALVGEAGTGALPSFQGRKLRATKLWISAWSNWV